jgi:hypothetical protein
MIVAFLSSEVREASGTCSLRTPNTKCYQLNNKTELEIYFSRSLGLSLVTLGILNILLTGSVPLSSRIERPSPLLNPHLCFPNSQY